MTYRTKIPIRKASGKCTEEIFYEKNIILVKLSNVMMQLEYCAFEIR